MTEPTPAGNSDTAFEQHVLGAVLQDDSLVDTVDLQASEFEPSEHRSIWRAAKTLAANGKPVDVLTVNDYLKQGGQDWPGLAAYLAELVEQTPTTAHAEHYAGKVREAAGRRKLKELALTLAEDDGDLKALLDTAESRLLDIRQAASSGAMQSAADGIQDALKHLRHLADNAGELTGLATGFTDLDRLTGGLQRGNMVVLAGRPSMGKTTLALNMAANVALAEHPVAVFSLEMTARELWLRLLCCEALVDSANVRTGLFSREDWRRLNDAGERLHGTSLHISDSVPTVAGIRAQAKRLKPRLIIVDYLQLLASDGRTDNRQQDVSAMSRALKRLAVELDCTVLALSQLNREAEHRRPPKPRLADLRDSGTIEQDADLVALLYRDEVYNEDSDAPGIAEVDIAKHRNGGAGKLCLTFRGEFTRFENHAAETRAGGWAAVNGSHWDDPPR